MAVPKKRLQVSSAGAGKMLKLLSETMRDEKSMKIKDIGCSFNPCAA